MRNVMTSNIYEPRGVMLVAGACLEQMQPEAYQTLAKQADCVYSLCLEESHINMAITKLGGVASTGQVTKIIFATVDRSPHCTQLHYIDHEIRRMMPHPPEMVHYVAAEGRLFEIPDAAIEQSKTLRTLAEKV